MGKSGKLVHPATSCRSTIYDLGSRIPEFHIGTGKTAQSDLLKRPAGGYDDLDRAIVSRYQSSTFFRAHEVLRRNARLELMLGLWVKHRIRTVLPISSQP